MQHRNVEVLSKTIGDYLHRQSLAEQVPNWEIRKSPLGGFGIFATRDIELGEVIFRDHPLILGPRTARTCPLSCVGCYTTELLEGCRRECGLRVCSKKCQESATHRMECKVIRQWKTGQFPEGGWEKLGRVLAPIRALFLSEEDKGVVRMLKAHRSDQHGFEVDIMKDVLRLEVKESEEEFMRLACAVMDANAFEVVVGSTSVKGLYPLGGLANHCCTPNTVHVFDERQRMVVRAAVFVQKDEEVFHSYSKCTWGTPTRRFHLFRTKHFWCRCPRCEDPTEFGSYVSAVLCKTCRTGRVIPVDPHNPTKWQCEGCLKTVGKKEVAALTSLLGSTLHSFDNDDIDIMLKFVLVKLPTLVPANNEAVVEMKYKLVWILGHDRNALWSELSDELLSVKEGFCRDLLELVETLKLGRCKMRGLLLYELYCCYEEMGRREAKRGNGFKSHNRQLLLEAADILMYDVSAPTEVKKLWPLEITVEEHL